MMSHRVRLFKEVFGINPFTDTFCTPRPFAVKVRAFMFPSNLSPLATNVSNHMKCDIPPYFLPYYHNLSRTRIQNPDEFSKNLFNVILDSYKLTEGYGGHFVDLDCERLAALDGVTIQKKEADLQQYMRDTGTEHVNNGDGFVLNYNK